MPPVVHETEHHGLRVRWVESDGPFRATLAFGVGIRDEPPHLMGITHLAEHVVFRAMGRYRTLENGTTSASTLSFFVADDEAGVVDFLHRLGAVLSDPRFDQTIVRAENHVIDAEGAGRLRPDPGLLTYRYGLSGVGVVDEGVPTHGSFTASEVADWVTTWCTADNAVLVLNGPPPADLDLRLPSTAARPPRRDAVSVVSRPTLVASGKSGLALSLLADQSVSHLVGQVLEEVLVAELRTRRTLIYSVDAHVTAVDETTDHLAMILDPIAEDLAATVRATVEVLRRTAREGIEPAAFEAVVALNRVGLAATTDWYEFDVDQELLHVAGLPSTSWETWRDQVERLTPDSVNASVATALETLVIAVDDDESDPEALAQELDLALDERRFWQSTRRRGHRGRRYRGRGRRLRWWARVSDQWLVLHQPGSTVRARLDQMVVAGRFDDGAVALIDERGNDDVLPAEIWPQAMLADVLERARPEAVRDFSWHDARPDRPTRD